MTLKIGDWVKLKNRNNLIGFVINQYSDPDGEQLSIRLSQPSDLKNKCLTVKSEEIIELDSELMEIEINSLIDLALLLKDKQWFEELRQLLNSSDQRHSL